MIRILKNTHIDFLGKRRLAAIISLAAIFAGIGSLIIKGGPALAIDFTGGTLAQVRFSVPADAADIRANLLEAGFDRPAIQQFGGPDEFLIRVPAGEATGDFTARLQAAFADREFEIRRLEQVGPKIGGELRGQAIKAVIYALLGILAYITVRFDRYYAVSAVVALTHDVLITLGIFSFLNLEIDLAIIAAFLTIVGYSLNDTIVVFDRIRETIRTDRQTEFVESVNNSINATLSRTLITSFTTFVVVLILYLFGGEVIRYFALALMIGVVVGTYSSIYVASPVMIYLEKHKGIIKGIRALLPIGRSRAST